VTIQNYRSQEALSGVDGLTLSGVVGGLVRVEEVEVRTGEQEGVIGDVVAGVEAEAEFAGAGGLEDLLRVAEALDILNVLVLERGVVPDKEGGASEVCELGVVQGAIAPGTLVQDEANLRGLCVGGVLDELFEETDSKRVVPHQLVEGG
jgi:hypothetical protein